MKVSTSLIVAAALAALSTSAISESTTDSTADTSSMLQAEGPETEQTSHTEDSTIEESESDETPLYDFSSASCSSDAMDPTTDLSAEGASTESSTGASTTEQTTSDGSFTDEQKSIWIERHNFFRVAALPWAAGNMQRMGWDEGLAKDAALAAASCTATTTTGINAYKSTSTDPSIVIEEAINAWVIEPSLSNIGSVVPPAAEGDGVGAGLYNSYTQVIWASTTSVGCAMASCSGGSMVVCDYSPAGNDGKSAWYVHYAQAMHCPTGTTAVQGLCVKEGDPANDLIAPIPDGKWSLQVYPTFIADIMATILKAAQARDAPGADVPTVISPAGSAPESSPGADTEETSLLEPETSSSSAAASSAETSFESLDATSTEDTTTGKSEDSADAFSDSLSSDKKPSADLATEATGEGMDVASGPESLMSASTELPGESSAFSTLGDSYLPSSAAAASSPSTEDYPASTTDFSSETSSEEDLPGKVKTSPETDSFLKNTETSASSESLMESQESVSNTDLAKQDDSIKEESSKPTSSAESSDSNLKATVLSSNPSNTVANGGTSLSATGIAGLIVLGVAAVVALA